MDSFKGNARIIIQPGDVNIPLTARLKTATTSTANDGSLPYGSTVHKAVATFHTQSGTATTHFNPTTLLSSNRITTLISYSSNLSYGRYHCKWLVTASRLGSTVTPMIREYDLHRVYVKDL